MRKTTVLLGKGALAIRAAEWFLASPDHELAAVVPVVPEPRWTDSLIAWAEARGVPHVASGHYRDLAPLGEPGRPIDLAFSVFYDKIIKAWFIGRCGRILNLHNGPLPRYRGVSPINWALKNGERAHGVTIHEITPGIDDGPVVAQTTYSIYPETDEVRDVYLRSLAYGWTLFEQTMPLLDRIQPRPQDHALATYYSAKENDLLGDRRGFTRGESLELAQAVGAA
jgi:methionyl-tRNA formyltransferase